MLDALRRSRPTSKQLVAIAPADGGRVSPRRSKDTAFGLLRNLAFAAGMAMAALGTALTASVATETLQRTAAEASSVSTQPPDVISFSVVSRPSLEQIAGMADDDAALIASMSQHLQPSPAAPAVLGAETAPARLSTFPRITFAGPTETTRIQALGLPSPSLVTPTQPPAPAPRPSAVVTPVPSVTEAAAALVISTPAPLVVKPAEPLSALRRFINVNITFYDCLDQGFCGRMANGRKVYEGAAACSYDLPLGTRFYIEDDPTNRIYRCDDRGLLSRTWVDIFWYSAADGWRWQEAVGRYGTIVVVAWGDEDD
jgi:hypothetical protein